MAYNPENNPYAPGDPGCYDLKWIVDQLLSIINNPGGAVTSVNGQTGDVVLSIPTVPTNISAFYNDAGYITLADLPIYDGGIG